MEPANSQAHYETIWNLVSTLAQPGRPYKNEICRYVLSQRVVIPDHIITKSNSFHFFGSKENDFWNIEQRRTLNILIFSKSVLPDFNGFAYIPCPQVKYAYVSANLSQSKYQIGVPKCGCIVNAWEAGAGNCRSGTLQNEERTRSRSLVPLH